MNHRATILTVVLLATTPSPVTAQESMPSAAAPQGSTPVELPKVRFFSSIADADLIAQLRADPMLRLLDEETSGCPIVLRVTNSVEPTSGGKAAGATTGLLAASTLGIIPIVTNEDYVVSYEFIVNNTVVSTHSYRHNFTRSRNLWSMDKRNTLGGEGLAWVKSTAAQFLAEAHNDSALAALAAEYKYYFGTTESVPATPATP